MSIFVSYARPNRGVAASIESTLERLGHDAWLDRELVGGDSWWDTILNHIETCDAMVFVISPATVKSRACLAEMNYADALGKQILPVGVEAVESVLIPEKLASLQIIDYTPHDEDSIIALVNALTQLEPPPPLPSPPPPRPAMPVSYVLRLGREARTAKNRDEQLSVVGKLTEVVETATSEEEQREAIAALRTMNERHDLTVTAKTNIDATLQRHERAPSPQPPPREPPPPPRTEPPKHSRPAVTQPVLPAVRSSPAPAPTPAPPPAPPASAATAPAATAQRPGHDRLGRAIVASCAFAVGPWITLGLGTSIVYLLAALLVPSPGRRMAIVLWTSFGAYTVVEILAFVGFASKEGSTPYTLGGVGLAILIVGGGLEAIALAPWVYRRVRAGKQGAISGK